MQYTITNIMMLKKLILFYNIAMKKRYGSQYMSASKVLNCTKEKLRKAK